MSKKQQNQGFRVPLGVCPACLGDKGTLIADYVDENDNWYPLYFESCPACEGSGTDEYLKVKPVTR